MGTHILCTGINHKTTGITFREQLSFQEDEIKASLAQATPLPADELVILSTCNRTELYAVCDEANFIGLENFWFATRKIHCDHQGRLYRLQGEAAIVHLLRVASGLDSMVLGEPQILGQVAHALELAREAGTAGKILNRLFQTAIRAGKRARAETALARNPASIPSVAVQLIASVVPNLPQARIAVVGAGEMAALTVKALRKRGVTHIQVLNRTLTRAEALAMRWQATATTLKHLPLALASADVLITSTSASHHIIHPHALREARPASRPLVILDIAVPRNVHPDVNKLPNIHVYDLDDLNRQLQHALGERKRAVPQVEAIISEELSSFKDYLRTLEVTYLIQALRSQAEAIRRAELQKTLRKLPHLGEAERQRLDIMTQAMIKKLLHRPIVGLRAVAGAPEAERYTAAVRTIFGLDEHVS